MQTEVNNQILTQTEWEDIEEERVSSQIVGSFWGAEVKKWSVHLEDNLYK